MRNVKYPPTNSGNTLQEIKRIMHFVLLLMNFNPDNTSALKMMFANESYNLPA